MSKNYFFLACIGLIFLSTSADASSLIQCTSNNKNHITIELQAKKILGKIVNCIDGDFIYDLTPCAPNNMWSLSRGTGVPEIVEYTARIQTMFDWNAGHTGSRVNNTEIFFSGGFYSNETWYFRIDRISGRGTLRLWTSAKPSTEETFAYTCQVAKKRF